MFYPLISKLFTKGKISIHTHCFSFIGHVLCKALKKDSFSHRIYLVMNEGLNLTKAGVEQWFLSANTAISFQLQPSLLCQALTLLCEVMHPKYPTGRILKYKFRVTQQLFLLPKSSIQVTCCWKRLCSCWAKLDFDKWNEWLCRVGDFWHSVYLVY